jgi:hypothetical protein
MKLLRLIIKREYVINQFLTKYRKAYIGSFPHHAFICGLLNLFTKELRITPHKKNDVVDSFTSVQNILVFWSNPFTIHYVMGNRGSQVI